MDDAVSSSAGVVLSPSDQARALLGHMDSLRMSWLRGRESWTVLQVRQLRRVGSVGALRLG